MDRKVILTEEKFKTDKATRVLMLYHQLLSGQVIDKVTYTLEYGVNERTFDRDIETIRLFLSDIYSGEQLLFDRESNTYYFSGKRPKYIDRMDAAVISKILLESRLLRKDEMHGLLNTILSSVTPYDAEVIKKYLAYDTQEYISDTDTAILKFVGDLYGVLKVGSDIEVMMKDSDGQIETIVVSPLKISCDKNRFYLIAAQNFSLKHVKKIGMEKIISFKSLNTTFAQGLKEKYYNTKEE